MTKLPQLFIRIGNDRYIPVSHPVNDRNLYFWDDSKQQILPDNGELKLQIVCGSPYKTLERP